MAQVVMILAVPLLMLLIIVVAFCSAFGPIMNPRRGAPQNPKPFTAIQLCDAFEAETAMLWETQIPALKIVGSAGPRGLKSEALRGWYRQSTRLYPELYEGADFEGWLQFLQEADLITRNGNAVVLTSTAVEFLKCRVAATAAV